MGRKFATARNAISKKDDDMALSEVLNKNIGILVVIVAVFMLMIVFFMGRIQAMEVMDSVSKITSNDCIAMYDPYVSSVKIYPNITNIENNASPFGDYNGKQ